MHLNGEGLLQSRGTRQVYGHAGRISASSGVMIVKAAIRVQFVVTNGRGDGHDVRQIYLAQDIPGTRENDAYYFQRFVAGLRQREPLSSHWWPPSVQTAQNPRGPGNRQIHHRLRNYVR